MRAPAIAAGLVVAAAVVVVSVVLVARDEGPSVTTPTGTVATAPATVPGTAPVPPVPEPLPEPGDFPGAPPEGGAVEVVRAEGGIALEARYFDPAGELTVVVSALRAAPTPATPGAGAVVRCGSRHGPTPGSAGRASPSAGACSTVAAPPRVRRAAALAAIRKARGVWNATKSHCRGLRDQSRARFLFAGSTPRRVGRDGVSTVDVGSLAALGGVCPGAVACTITWISGGNRATESDTRITSIDAGGFSTARRPASRRLDVQSVMVHESGHTLGFGHVQANDVVMNPFVKRGGVSGRLLGRGDAIASNAKY